MKAKYFAILCFCIFWIVVAFMASWLDRVPVNAQEKGEYPRQEMTFTVNSEKIDQDSVLVLFSTRGLLGILKEYKAYSDTVTTYVKHWSLTDYGDTSEVVSVPQRGTFMSVEGLMDWLENVKLK